MPNPQFARCPVCSRLMLEGQVRQHLTDEHPGAPTEPTHPTTPADVIDLADRREQANGTTPLTCPCGGTWWSTAGITLDDTSHVTAYACPLTCSDCGHEVWP